LPAAKKAACDISLAAFLWIKALASEDNVIPEQIRLVAGRVHKSHSP